MMDKNQETFGKPKYGLHGKPIPNFFYKSNSDARIALKKNPPKDLENIENYSTQKAGGNEQKTIEWYKNQEGFEPSPKYVSNREVR